MNTQSNEIRLRTTYKIGLLWKVLPHSVGKCPDLLIAHCIAQGAVDHGQAVDVTDGHCCGQREMFAAFFGKALKAVPVLKTCQQISFKFGIRKYKQLSKVLLFFIF